jgi:hypothetical protein
MKLYKEDPHQKENNPSQKQNNCDYDNARVPLAPFSQALHLKLIVLRLDLIADISGIAACFRRYRRFEGTNA